jgi:hypothetical protein
MLCVALLRFWIQASAGRWLSRSILSPDMAGIKASMTLGGIADGGTYFFCPRTASGTVGHHRGDDVLVPAPAGLRGTLPDRCLHVVSSGSEPRSGSSRCPKIRTKPPLLNSQKPAASDSPAGASVGVVAFPCCYWAISARSGGTRSDPRRLSRHRRCARNARFSRCPRSQVLRGHFASGNLGSRIRDRAAAGSSRPNNLIQQAPN